MLKTKIADISVIILTILLFFTSCIPQKTTDEPVPVDLAKKQEYKLVTPTQEELDEIAVRLDPILSMYLSDYDCKKDNIYKTLFSYDHLDYVYPKYDNEVAEYIAKPLVVNSENNFCLWDISGIYSKDPLNKFSIPDEVYDEDGNVNFDRVEELYSDGNHVAIGHNMFSGAYIDWLVEGVWNSKADHDTFFEFEDGTLLYYYDGNYYTPELWSGRGGGVFYYPIIDSITPLEDGKYEIVYQLYDAVDEYYSTSKAVIGMKETSNGFRFWSIFSIDYNYTGDKFNY